MARTIWIVLQFGLAMMIALLLDCVNALVAVAILISGTTRGIAGSLRQADELSITVVPTAAKSGAYWREAAAPAEKMA